MLKRLCGARAESSALDITEYGWFELDIEEGSDSLR